MPVIAYEQLSGHVHIAWLLPEFYFRICHVCVPALVNVTELNIFKEILATICSRVCGNKTVIFARKSGHLFVVTKQSF